MHLSDSGTLEAAAIYQPSDVERVLDGARLPEDKDAIAQKLIDDNLRFEEEPIITAVEKEGVVSEPTVTAMQAVTAKKEGIMAKFSRFSDKFKGFFKGRESNTTQSKPAVVFAAVEATPEVKNRLSVAQTHVEAAQAVEATFQSKVNEAERRKMDTIESATQALENRIKTYGPQGEAQVRQLLGLVFSDSRALVNQYRQDIKSFERYGVPDRQDVRAQYEAKKSAMAKEMQMIEYLTGLAQDGALQRLLAEGAQ
jgi:hypothetical protein